MDRFKKYLVQRERFFFIKGLALDDKIAVITIDICDTNAFEKIVTLFKNNGIQIDTIYVSNISEWMENEQKTQFVSTIVMLLFDDDTLLIDAVKQMHNAFRLAHIEQKTHIHQLSFSDMLSKEIIQLVVSAKQIKGNLNTWFWLSDKKDHKEVLQERMTVLGKEQESNNCTAYGESKLIFLNNYESGVNEILQEEFSTSCSI